MTPLAMNAETPTHDNNVRLVVVDDQQQPAYLKRAVQLEKAMVKAAAALGVESEDMPALYGLCVQAQVSGLVLRQRAAVGDAFGQVRAVDVLRDQVGGVSGQVVVEYSGSAGGVHGAQRGDFPAEPDQELLVSSKVGVQVLTATRAPPGVRAR